MEEFFTKTRSEVSCSCVNGLILKIIELVGNLEQDAALDVFSGYYQYIQVFLKWQAVAFNPSSDPYLWFLEKRTFPKSLNVKNPKMYLAGFKLAMAFYEKLPTSVYLYEYNIELITLAYHLSYNRKIQKPTTLDPTLHLPKPKW